MLEAIVASTLALLSDIAPGLAAASSIAKVIDALVALIPAVIQYAKDLYPTIKNVIATLRGNAAITSEQMDQLDAIEAKADADFDAAVAAAEAEDKAASTP